MSLHMNESALRPTIKELLDNHITDSNEKGRLKSWAKVYEADRKSRKTFVHVGVDAILYMQ